MYFDVTSPRDAGLTLSERELTGAGAPTVPSQSGRHHLALQ